MSPEIDHIILPVNDEAESIAFYTAVLGFEDGGPQPPFRVVRVSPTFTLQLAPWGTEGNWHLAFAFTKSEFDAAWTRVKEAGIPFGDSFHSADNGKDPGDESGARGDGKAVYLLDPNRHLIELRYY